MRINITKKGLGPKKKVVVKSKSNIERGNSGQGGWSVNYLNRRKKLMEPKK